MYLLNVFVNGCYRCTYNATERHHFLPVIQEEIRDWYECETKEGLREVWNDLDKLVSHVNKASKNMEFILWEQELERPRSPIPFEEVE